MTNSHEDDSLIFDDDAGRSYGSSTETVRPHMMRGIYPGREMDKTLTLKVAGDFVFCPANTESWDYDAANYTNSLPRALNMALEKKRLKLERFLKTYGKSLGRRHLQQLRSFATSSNGLITDVFREKIWPVLAANISMVRRYTAFECDQDSNGSVHREENGSWRSDDELLDGSGPDGDVTDSDFESAHSSFSTDDGAEEFGDDEAGTNGRRKGETSEPSVEELRRHKDWSQVELDVDRTLSRFPPDINDEERGTLQRDLTPLVIRTLWSDPDFSYYQGFHDVCLTLLLVLGNVEKTLAAAKALVKRSCFRNYLVGTLEETALRELQHLYVLLYLHDHELEKHMRLAELGCLFALSWPLTWFSHSLHHYGQIVSFFDLFLASHPMMPVYVAAALVVERREDILSHEADMPTLHHLLTNVPSELNVDRILMTSQNLMARFPPSLVTGVYKREYEKMCSRQRRQRISIAKLQQRIPKPGTVPRSNLFSISPWVMAGTAASAVALYLYVANSYLHHSSLM